MTDPTSAERRAAAFRATRDAHSTEIAEDYVELISDLIIEHGEARLTDLAEYMGVTHATAAKVVQRLKGLQLVQNRPYRSLFLTPAGEGIAATSRLRHQRVVDFLLALGVTRDTAEIDAEGIEHHVSDETLERMSLVVTRLADQPESGSLHAAFLSVTKSGRPSPRQVFANAAAKAEDRNG